MEGKRIDWATLVMTVVSVVGSAAAFVGLYVALSLPVIQTLQRL